MCSLVITHSAAGAKGLRLNSSVAQTYFRFNSRVFALASKNVGYVLYGCNKL